MARSEPVTGTGAYWRLMERAMRRFRSGDPEAVRGVYAAVRSTSPAHPALTAMLDALRRAATAN